MTDFYDRQGNPLELLAWARLYEDDDYRQLRVTDLGTYVVSTIWRGFDTRLANPDGPPRIFEVAIWSTTAGNDPQNCDGQTYQYPDEELALGAHDWTCTQIMSAGL